MGICTFLGLSDFDFSPYREKLSNLLKHLITEHNITDFYSAGRSPFDFFAAGVVHELKDEYPNIQNTIVSPKNLLQKADLSPIYDNTIFLGNPKLHALGAATLDTAYRMIDNSDILVSGSRNTAGEHVFTAYAEKAKKPIFFLF